MPLFLRIALLAAVGLAIPLRSLSAAPSSATASHLTVLHQAAGRLAQDSPRAVAAWALRQPSVAAAAVGRDGKTVDLHFRDGTEMLVLPAGMSTVKVDPASARSVRPLIEAQSAPQAAVWEPFATELNIGPHAGDPEVQALQSAGFQVSQAYDSAVNVALMQTMPQYQVLYMHTHSGITANGDGVLATDQLAYAGDSSMQPYISEGSVTTVGVAGDATDAFYAITAKFVTLHMGSFSHDSMLFFNGCSLLGATAFWQAFAAKGAGALVSWTGDATTYDDYLSASAFMNQMAQGATISGAIKTLKANGYGTSGSAVMGYEGDGSISLAQASGGQPTPSPTASPSPKPTRTPRPKPTPRPTATSTATLPPIHIVSLRNAIKPGGHQQISVKGPANARIVAHITFPNGHTKSISATIGASGTGTIGFKQPGSQISRSSHRAMVTVQIGNNAATLVSDSYVIKFGRVDLVLGAQGEGKATVWLHSTPHTAVRVQVTDGGKRHTLRVKTGRKGWVHLKNRDVGKGQVALTASVTIRHHAYHTTLHTAL